MKMKVILSVLVLSLIFPSLSQAQNLPDKAKLLADIERVKGLSNKERETLRQAIEKIPEDTNVSKKKLPNVSEEEKRRAIEIMKMNPELVREYQQELKEIEIQEKAVSPTTAEPSVKMHKRHPDWERLPEPQKRALQAWEEKKARQKEMREQYKEQVRQRSLSGTYDNGGVE